MLGSGSIRNLGATIGGEVDKLKDPKVKAFFLVNPSNPPSARISMKTLERIAAIVKENDWTQAEAAKHCGVTQPRINDLLRGRVSRFSLDALVNIATAIGRRVHVELDIT